MDTVNNRLEYSSTPEYKIFAQGGLFMSIGIIMMLSMHFETLPIPIEVQVMPLTSVLALLFLPFVTRNIERTPLLMAVLIFSVFVLLHSLILLVIDMLLGEPPIRMFSWFRQFLAFVLGIFIYLGFRKTLLYIDNKKVLKYVILGAVPAYLLSFLNIIWGGLNQQWAGTIVIAVRSFVAPTGHYSPFRTSGFALEPSHFASILVILVVPFLFVLFSQKKYRKIAIIVLIATLLSFLWTFSLMGFIVLAFVIAIGLFLGPNKRFLISLSVILIIIFIGSLLLFPNNQIVRNINALIVGVGTISFDDRFYGTFAPFLSSFSSFTMIGYGLGGTVSHFDKIVPEHLQAALSAVKWDELPNLATLIGRLMAETGAIGLFLFLLVLGVGLWQLQILIKNVHSRDIVFLQSIRLGLVGTLFTLSFAFGSFHLPFLWFWLALIDSRYLKYTTGNIEKYK
jgi:hypothetical protein